MSSFIRAMSSSSPSLLLFAARASGGSSSSCPSWCGSGFPTAALGPGASSWMEEIRTWWRASVLAPHPWHQTRAMLQQWASHLHPRPSLDTCTAEGRVHHKWQLATTATVQVYIGDFSVFRVELHLSLPLYILCISSSGSPICVRPAQRRFSPPGPSSPRFL